MEQAELNLLFVGSKAQSKGELYRALTVEGGLYLPPQKECPMLFISQIAIHDKKVFILILLLSISLYLGVAIKGCECKESAPD